MIDFCSSTFGASGFLIYKFYLTSTLGAGFDSLTKGGLNLPLGFGISDALLTWSESDYSSHGLGDFYCFYF